jgi:hypothetical protein
MLGNAMVVFRPEIVARQKKDQVYVYFPYKMCVEERDEYSTA